MSGQRLARRVSALTAALVALIAAGSWFVLGAQEALGALVGGVVTVGNFLWLRWTASRALRGAAVRPERAWHRAFWLGASGARFGVVALTLGAVVTLGWVGLAGLLVSLTALPITVVAAGLAESRSS